MIDFSGVATLAAVGLGTILFGVAAALAAAIGGIATVFGAAFWPAALWALAARSGR